MVVNVRTNPMCIHNCEELSTTIHKYPLLQFIHSSTHSLINSFRSTHSNPFTPPNSFIRSNSFTNPLIQIRSLIHIHSLILLFKFIHSFTHSLTQIHSLVQIHALIQIHSFQCNEPLESNSINYFEHVQFHVPVCTPT